jgi:FtsZ-binding cell division protein ZapB
MSIEYTAFRQVGTELPLLVFERNLMDLAKKVGRPAPEIKGGIIPEFAEGDRCWHVVCTLRGGVVPPLSDELTITVLERTWTDGVVRVMQQALALLVHHHREQLVDTRYEYFGRRDAQGGRPEATPHPILGYHLDHMEYLLSYSQVQMDRARMRCDIKDAVIRHLRVDLDAARLDASRQRKIRCALNKRIRGLRLQVKELNEQVSEMESKMEEIEEESEELRKENETLLSADDDAEDMDMEPESEQEDDDLAGEEEDPEEPPFVEDTIDLTTDT